MSEVKLTPVAKGLIGLILLGLAGTAAWMILKPGDATPAVDEDGKKGDGTKPVAAGGVLGSDGNPLKVSIVSFHGYAPALVANGNSLTTKSGSIYAKKNVNVEFVIQDDIPTLNTVFESGAAHCAWRTSDFWAQEQPNLRNNKLDGRAVLVVDNTQGGDAIIAKDPAIKRVEDLAGKKVALLQYTPSHGMIIDAVNNSSLTARQKTRIEYVFINAEGGTAAVRAALTSGDVDAAVLWDPDLSLAMKSAGAHVIYSTKIATNLIYDVMVCDKRVLDKPENQDAIQGFVSGWLEGVDAARKDPDNAVQALIDTEEFFAVLAKDEGRPFIKGLFSNLVWTNLADNVRILGLAGDTNHYERVYRRFDSIYRSAGSLANPNSPVINPQESFEYKYIRSLLKEAPAVREVAQKPQFTFEEEERKKVHESNTAVVTKPVTVNFATGSFELNKRSQQTIDKEMAPLIESNGSAYFEVSGNTDSTGSKKTNMKLSKQRAQAVVDYLVKQWEFPRERFVVVGNGPDKPLCNEKKPEDGASVDDCRSMNRQTRVAVLSRQTP